MNFPLFYLQKWEKSAAENRVGKIEINVILNFPILDFLAPLDVSMNKSFLKETACEKIIFLKSTFSDFFLHRQWWWKDDA